MSSLVNATSVGFFGKSWLNDFSSLSSVMKSFFGSGLVPNLGMVYFQEGKSFVVADIPGLIKGAHEGKGLGTQFLRHIERTKVLVYLVECTSPDPKKDFMTLESELKSFNQDLPKKPTLVAFTKLDIADAPLRKSLKKIKFRKGISVHFISAVTGEELSGLVAAMWKVLEKKK